MISYLRSVPVPLKVARWLAFVDGLVLPLFGFAYLAGGQGGRGAVTLLLAPVVMAGSGSFARPRRRSPVIGAALVAGAAMVAPMVLPIGLAIACAALASWGVAGGGAHQAPVPATEASASSRSPVDAAAAGPGAGAAESALRDVGAELRVWTHTPAPPSPLEPEGPADVLYSVEHLTKHFPVRGGLFGKTVAEVQAVTDVSFTVGRGETLGIVGESGCGKTTTGRLLLRLVPATSGRLMFEGQDLRRLRRGAMTALRPKMQIIFQDPYASLNPRLPIGDIIGEGLYNAGMRSHAERERRVADMLDRVGLRRYSVNRYPHEFSGGQRQRIGIARALVMRPTFIVADEPVSALDVSIQSQVLNLLSDLQDEFTLTYLFISHNLQVVQHVSDRVGVMYLGKLVELAPSAELYRAPKHPYTQALLSAIPLADPTRRRQRPLIRGDVPSAINPPAGCRFHTRCPIAQPICREVEPRFEPKGGNPRHLAACHFSDTRAVDELATAATL